MVSFLTNDCVQCLYQYSITAVWSSWQRRWQFNSSPSACQKAVNVEIQDSLCQQGIAKDHVTVNWWFISQHCWLLQEQWCWRIVESHNSKLLVNLSTFQGGVLHNGMWQSHLKDRLLRERCRHGQDHSALLFIGAEAVYPDCVIQNICSESRFIKTKEDIRYLFWAKWRFFDFVRCLVQ